MALGSPPPPPPPSASNLGYRLILAWETQTLDEWQNAGPREGNAARWNEDRKQSPFSSILFHCLGNKSTKEDTEAGTFTKKNRINKSRRKQVGALHNCTVIDPKMKAFVPDKLCEQFNPCRDAVGFARSTMNSGQDTWMMCIRTHSRKLKESGYTI